MFSGTGPTGTSTATRSRAEGPRAVTAGTPDRASGSASCAMDRAERGRSGAGRNKTRAADTGAPMVGGEWSEAELNATMGSPANGNYTAMGTLPVVPPAAGATGPSTASRNIVEAPRTGTGASPGCSRRQPGPCRLALGVSRARTVGRVGGSSGLKWDSRPTRPHPVCGRKRAQSTGGDGSEADVGAITPVTIYRTTEMIEPDTYKVSAARTRGRAYSRNPARFGPGCWVAATPLPGLTRCKLSFTGLLSLRVPLFIIVKSTYFILFQRVNML
jgi:hypothetical protein